MTRSNLKGSHPQPLCDETLTHTLHPLVIRARITGFKTKTTHYFMHSYHDLNAIKNLVHHDFEAVNQLIVRNLTSQVELISELCHHIIASGGKRLRPLMVLLAAKACGYTGTQHIDLAAAVEYFHTATLLHDDVVDESTLRRGQETANEIWGSKPCILVGDYLFTQAVQLMVGCKNLQILSLFSDIAHEISCGELKQLNHRYNIHMSLEDYFDVIRSKTALLFSASAALGGSVSHPTTETVAALSAYGLHVGNAFQLIDDALDYCATSETLGKNIGDDLNNGKLTLPLLYALQQSQGSQQKTIQQSIETGTRAHLDEILAIIEDTQAIPYTYRIAHQEIDKALSALTLLEDTEYKQGLIQLAQFAVSRDH